MSGPTSPDPDATVLRSPASGWPEAQPTAGPGPASPTAWPAPSASPASSAGPQAWPAPPAGSPQSPHPDPGHGGIATLPSLPDANTALAPIDPRSGEPRRPWTIWVATVLCYLTGAIVAVALGMIFLDAITKFAVASWLTGTVQTEPGSWLRVLLVCCCALIAAAVAGAAGVVGYHAWNGRGWTKIGGIVATVVAALSLMLTPLAAVSIAPVAIAAGLVWLPVSGRFFATFEALRRPVPPMPAPLHNVYYGPLARFR